MIAASVVIDGMMRAAMSEDEIEEYVRTKLGIQISQEMMKTMTITTKQDPITDSVTYTTSIPIHHTTSNTITVAGYNGTVSAGNFTNNHTSGIIKNNQEMRVIEYTKNGKVTRVELQYYDGDNWIKVPRYQFEE